MIEDKKENLDEKLLAGALEYLAELFLDSRIARFFLLGETLTSAKAGELTGSFLDLGLFENDAKNGLNLNYAAAGNHISNYKQEPDRITFRVKEVPVVIRLLPTELDCLKFADFLIYKHIEPSLYFPNPPVAFEKWEQEQGKNK